MCLMDNGVCDGTICLPVVECTNEDLTNINPRACQCGTATCQSKVLWCDKTTNNNKCLGDCQVNILPAEGCICNNKKCIGNCVSNTCQVPTTCYNTVPLIENALVCNCGSALCGNGRNFCDSSVNLCWDSEVDCPTNSLVSNCMCGQQYCAKNNSCSNGNCSTIPDCKYTKVQDGVNSNSCVCGSTVCL